MDPSDAAAGVVSLMATKYGIQEDMAIADFVRSKTFRIILEDQAIAQLPPEEILDIYEKERGGQHP